MSTLLTLGIALGFAGGIVVIASRSNTHVLAGCLMKAVGVVLVYAGIQ